MTFINLMLKQVWSSGWLLHSTWTLLMKSHKFAYDSWIRAKKNIEQEKWRLINAMYRGSVESFFPYGKYNDEIFVFLHRFRILFIFRSKRKRQTEKEQSVFKAALYSIALIHNRISSYVLPWTINLWLDVLRIVCVTKTLNVCILLLFSM